jgi:RNA polymerase primary sigma factor
MKLGRTITAPSGVDAIIAQISRPVITDRAEELRLVALAKKGDKTAMRRLLGANVGIVMSIAKRYAGKGLDIEDLFLLGMGGLYKAVPRFDAEKGIRLTTYASWWIRSEIQEGIVEGAHAVRVSRHILDTLKKAARAERSLCCASRDEPTTAEVAAAIGIKPGRLEEMRAAGIAAMMTSFDAPVSAESENAHIDFYRPPDTVDKNAMSLLVERQDAEALHRAIDAALSPIERAVIEERFFNDRTLVETGILIAPHTQSGEPVSRERARQLEEKAIAKLAKALAKIAPDST